MIFHGIISCVLFFFISTLLTFDSGSASIAEMNAIFPTLNQLARYLSIDAFDIEALAAHISEMNVRFTVDILKSKFQSNIKGVSLTENCGLFYPTYYMHIDDSILAEAFKVVGGGNITTFIVRYHSHETPYKSDKHRNHNNKTSTATLPSLRAAELIPEIEMFGEDDDHWKSWLHVEKTGSSFATTAMQLGYRWIAHEPSPRKKCLQNMCSLISLFRDPAQRAVSWFYFSKFSRVCIRQSNRNPKDIKSCFKEHVDVLYNDSKYKKDLSACQCKAVLGYHCEEKRSKLPIELQSDKAISQRAIELLWKEYDFVGITDDFDASVTLAHQVLGGQLDLNTALIKYNTREQHGYYSEAFEVSNDLSNTFRQEENKENDDQSFDTSYDTSSKYGIDHYSLPPIPESRYKECSEYHCSNKPDEILFKQVKKLFFRNILLHMKTPVRVIDTSKYNRELILPQDQSLLNPKYEYSQNLTRIWDREFSMMSNSECIVL